jgi:hypothetical protein
LSPHEAAIDYGWIRFYQWMNENRNGPAMAEVLMFTIPRLYVHNENWGMTDEPSELLDIKDK